jgi:hypothetical protein
MNDKYNNGHSKLKKLDRKLFGEPVNLILDNCPLGFSPSDAGKIPVEKIEKSLKAMKIINNIDID